MLWSMALVSVMGMTGAVEATIEDLVKQISPQKLRATVEKLASFHTRNTLSKDVWDAAEWLRAEFAKLPEIRAELMKYKLMPSRRVPTEQDAVQVVATLPGKTNRMILIGGHLDSLNLQADPMTGRAPGANDDASGVALALELARVMSSRKWQHTLVFVGFTGEEQGLLGSRALAERAKAEGWRIDAVLSSDTVGSSSNKAGQKDALHVRVFSDETVPYGSRELARFAEWITRARVSSGRSKFGIKLVMRKDRFGRGGDHTPFHEAGFPAVRWIEVHEEYTRQHTPDDLPKYMDWGYLANVVRMNLIVAGALADAAEPPTNVQVVRDQSHDTTLRWQSTRGVEYMVYWRDTASAVWQGAAKAGAGSSYKLKGINKDDHLFAVGAEGGVPVAAQ